MPGGFDDHECATCGREFPAGWRARENHCNATGHRRPAFECNRCPRWFNSQNACWQHMQDTNHFQYDCDFCDKTWPTTVELAQHEKDGHNYCQPCDRTFMNANNLDQHMKSRVHLGSTITCSFCGVRHTTATGLTHHLERGSCPNAPQLDRDTLYEFVRSKDPSGVISKKLIGWTGVSDTYQATDRAWNGHCFECYLCHRGFNSLHGLNQHLTSPVHQQALYHCFKPQCRRDFTTLGALINHLESETCGAVRFEQVQSGIGNLICNGRLLT